MVEAGYSATWVICSGAHRSVMSRDRLQRRRLTEAVRRLGLPSDSACQQAGLRLEDDAYWLVSVKMVETMRWPKAL